MAPALLVNVDWTFRMGGGWTAAAVLGIVLAPCFIEGFRHAPGWENRLLLLACGLFGMYVNALVAMNNASHASEDEKTARKQHNLAAETASSQSSQSSQRRAALVELAGETPSATYEAQIQAAINKDIAKWTATVQCSDVTARKSGTYCAEINLLKGKKKAAKAREWIDDHPVTQEAKTSEDPFADNFPQFAAGFGITVRRENATAHLNGVRSMWLEILDGVGPMAILLMRDIILGRVRQTRLEPRPVPQRPEPVEQKVEFVVEPPVDCREVMRKAKADRDEDLRRRRAIFIAEELEAFPGVSMPTSDPWRMWQRRCAKHGEEKGDQRSFTQQMREHFDHDPDPVGHRPRFLNVRAKPKAAQLALVR
jgi:hypothetical protein